MKRIISILSALVIMATMLSGLSFTALAKTSWSCGKNVVAELDGDVLTLSGKGEMNSYGLTDNTAPWKDESIESVRISQGITNVGAYAFADLKALKSVYIPVSVEKIGAGAFYGDISLAEIDILTVNCHIASTNSIPANPTLLVVKCRENADFISQLSDMGIDYETKGTILITFNFADGRESEVQFYFSPAHESEVIYPEHSAPSHFDDNGTDKHRVYTEWLSNGYNLPDEITKNKTVVESGEVQTCTAGDTKTVKPTCTKKGYTSVFCSGCGYELERRDEKAELGHSWDSGKVTTAPTCTKAGVRTYGCFRCTVTKTQSVAATGHSYKTTTTKATLSSNGSVVTKCASCGDVSSKTTVYYPKTFTLGTKSYIYNGKERKPSVTVKDTKGNKLVKGTDYTVSYTNNKKVGTATATVKFKGKYSGTKKLSYKIVPKSTKLTKLTAKSKSFTAKWSKQTTQTTGYQLQYSASSKFTNKSTKTVTISKNKTTSKTVNKLKGNKKYYVRIRTYKTVDGKKYYSAWSKKITVTTKK